MKDGDPKKYCGPKPQPEEALYQLATGLEYIHKMQLIHCNLKPKNVLIWSGNSSTVMKWTNFGTSKQVDEKGTCPINEIKEEEWIAPEILEMLENEEMNIQSENKATLFWECSTFKSDVFAEGLVFGYFLLAGVHPFGYIGWKIQANISQNDPINLKSKYKSQKCTNFLIIKKTKHVRFTIIPEIEPSSLSELTMKMLNNQPENRLTSSDVVEELEIIRVI
jgi:serine/threonine protein kinase